MGEKGDEERVVRVGNLGLCEPLYRHVRGPVVVVRLFEHWAEVVDASGQIELVWSGDVRRLA